MKNIVISAKKIELTEELTNYIYLEVDKKILPQIDESVKVKIFIQELNNHTYKIDINVRIENIKINTSSIDDELVKCLKDTIDKTYIKVKKINKKIKRKDDLKNNKQIAKLCDDIFIVRKNAVLKDSNYLNSFPLESTIQNDEDFEFVKSKKLDLKPMSPTEAVLQMNLTGHYFFLFLNCNTNEKSIVYKRNDGKYGIIE